MRSPSVSATNTRQLLAPRSIAAQVAVAMLGVAAYARQPPITFGFRTAAAHRPARNRRLLAGRRGLRVLDRRSGGVAYPQLDLVRTVGTPLRGYAHAHMSSRWGRVEPRDVHEYRCCMHSRTRHEWQMGVRDAYTISWLLYSSVASGSRDCC